MHPSAFPEVGYPWGGLPAHARLAGRPLQRALVGEGAPVVRAHRLARRVGARRRARALAAGAPHAVGALDSAA